MRWNLALGTLSPDPPREKAPCDEDARLDL